MAPKFKIRIQMNRKVSRRETNDKRKSIIGKFWLLPLTNLRRATDDELNSSSSQMTAPEKKRVEHKRLRFDICCFHSLLPSPFVVPPKIRKTHDDNFLHFSSVNCCLFWESSVFRRIVRFNFPPFSRFSENEKSVSPLNAN